MQFSGIVSRVRRPEYTGENRCTPCTVVNVGFSAALAAAVGVVASPVSGFAVLVASLGLVYLRGYLVPGTPTLTKRYLPDRVLRLFDKGTDPVVDGTAGRSTGASVSTGGVADGGTAARESPDADAPGEEGDATCREGPLGGDGAGDEVPVESLLMDAALVVPCADGEDICLDGEFEADWEDALPDPDGVDVDAVARGFGLDHDRFSLDAGGSLYVAESDAPRRVQWGTRASLSADLAAARLLADRLPRWEDLSPEARHRVLKGLRIFLDTCPACGGDVVTDERDVGGCCREVWATLRVCEDCDEYLLEIDSEMSDDTPL